MNKILTLLVITLSLFQTTYGQTNFLDKGNQYLNEENYVAAEQTFREAIKSDGSNLVYQCQLALSLINQNKNTEAQLVVDKILLKDANNVGAIWYGGMNSFSDKNGDLRKAISYFERTISLIDKKQGQYFSANWFIGRSYQILLQTDGLSYKEVSRMLDCYSMYLKLQPDAEDAKKINAFVEHIKTIRPPSNVEKWKSL